MKRIQKGDTVVVIAGKKKGAKSTVVAVSWERVTLDWVNVVKKAVKGEGFKEKEASIHISNVQIWDEKAKKPTKVWIREDKKGKKERFMKASWESIK